MIFMNSRSSSFGRNLKSLLTSKQQTWQRRSSNWWVYQRNAQPADSVDPITPMSVSSTLCLLRVPKQQIEPWFFIKNVDIHVLKIIFIRTKLNISTDLETTDLTTSKFKLVSLPAKCATGRFGRHDHPNARVFDFVTLADPQKTHQTLSLHKKCRYSCTQGYLHSDEI